MSNRGEEQKKQNEESKYLIYPDSSIKLFFDLLAFFLIIYQILAVPFTICFNYANHSQSIFEYVNDFIFIIDIFITFNTGFYDGGTLIMSRLEISKNYLKGWFTFDLISSFPYSFFFDFVELSLKSSTSPNAPGLLKVLRIVRFFRIARLLKMVKLRSMFFKIEEVLSSDNLKGIMVYLKLMIVFFLLWHCVACVFFSLSVSEFESVYDSIISKTDDLMFKEISEQYVYMLYFIVTTFFTTGYGDIYPISANEKLFALFVMLIFYSMFCFMVSKIRNMVQKSLEMDQDLKSKLKTVRSFFKDKNLPTSFTSKVTKYLEFMYTESKNRRLEDTDIFSLLNDKLGNELRIELNKKIILNFKMLQRSEYDLIVNKLCSCVYEEIVSPNEVLITEGDIISKRMYFIDNGTIILYHESTSIFLKELGSSDYLGEISFFTVSPKKLPRSCSAITKNFCNLKFILQPEFLRLIEELHQSEMKNEIMDLFNKFNKENLFNKLDVKCFFCSQAHVIKDCPQFHKNEKLFFLSKEREMNYLDRIKSLGTLSDFKKVNMNHFNLLKKAKFAKKDKTGRRQNITLNFADIK